MNLREKIEKEITDKVMTKLASERVELSVIDDISKYNKRANTMKNEAFDLLEKTQIAFKQVIQNYGLVVDVAEKGEKLAKELGIDSKEISNKLNAAKENISKFKKYTNLK